MELHEYQAKEILERFGIPVPKYFVAETAHEVRDRLHEFHFSEAVVKIQVHAGGRGKAGGIKVCKNREEIFHEARALIGMKIVNRQTGPQGLIAKKVMVSELIDIEKEYYLACTIDRKKGTCVLIASTAGGVDIEETAKTNPKKIFVQEIEKNKKVDTKAISSFLGIEVDDFVQKIVEAFFASDATLLEINPLVRTKQGNFVALDAKMTIDDNALYRQPEIAQMQEESTESSIEQEAKKHDLAYVELDGSIGCMVNGAGLAMATCDLIQLKGGSPANFLDVGGGASLEKVQKSLEILFLDPRVKAILVNIFGGIMNCEIIANALKASLHNRKETPPIVLRMEGTRVKEAKEIIKKAHLNVISCDDLDDAAKQVVQREHGNTSQSK